MTQLLTIPVPTASPTDAEHRVDLWAELRRLSSGDAEMLAQRRESVRRSRLARRKS